MYVVLLLLYSSELETVLLPPGQAARFEEPWLWRGKFSFIMSFQFS